MKWLIFSLWKITTEILQYFSKYKFRSLVSIAYEINY